MNFAGCGEPAAQPAGVPGAGEQDGQLPAAAGDAEQLRGRGLRHPHPRPRRQEHLPRGHAQPSHRQGGPSY